ncbi:MAG: hypothetical protein LQ341_003789 [Variospora aurantia]|nr:MAG: hypothetical protein LQ341_003789 [Variospora aurantia]
MSSAVFFGRLCLRSAFRRSPLRQPPTRHPICIQRSFTYRSASNGGQGRRRILYSLLTPAAFVRLSEEDNGDGKTPEEHMLEASRKEIKKSIPDSAHGLTRAWKGLCLFLDLYIYEPIATGFRFLHLALIFLPVIAAIPVIWLGRKVKERDNERAGTLWWYNFLVTSMERAGPAFIKVCPAHPLSPQKFS